MVVFSVLPSSSPGHLRFTFRSIASSSEELGRASPDSAQDRKGRRAWRARRRASSRPLRAGPWAAGLPRNLAIQASESDHDFCAGQRQLLAIVRALAIGPSLLPPDGATSNIDSETAARPQAALKLPMRGRTTTVVARRLGTPEKMDHIAEWTTAASPRRAATPCRWRRRAAAG